MPQISFYLLFCCSILLTAVTGCSSSSELSTHKSGEVSEADKLLVDSELRTQSVEGPEILSLETMDAFETSPPGWGLSRKVYTGFPGEPLTSTEGTGVLVFSQQSDAEELLITRQKYGNHMVELEFMLQSETCFSLMMHSRYEIRLCDAGANTGSNAERPGTIHYGAGNIISPLERASRAPGVWQKLAVDFQAPKTDRQGNKYSNAGMARVLLNGEVIHRAIELPQPSQRAISQSEVSEAPLALKVDSGRAAFRNIGFYDDKKIQIKNLQYAYHEENLDNNRWLENAAPEYESSTDQITSTHARRGNSFALRYEGALEIPVSGAYRFESIARGEVTLKVDGETLLQPSPQSENPLHINLTDRSNGVLSLDSGEYPFTLQYKKQQSGSPALSVFVTGPGIKKQAITSTDGAWRPAVQASPMIVEPARQAVIIRSHLEHKDKMVLNGISVGDPEGVHYSMDTGNAAILQVWNDRFLDAGPIWTGRGMNPDTRMVAGAGIPESRISFSGRPAIAFLEDAEEVWPDSVNSSYRFLGYKNDDVGRPMFRYQFEEVKVQETYRPGMAEYGSSLIREISLEKDAEAGVWILLADGNTIEKRDSGIYSVDDNYFIEISPDSQIHHRQIDGKEELLLHVPVPLQNSSFTTTYIW